jgi:hypothetical protein
MDAFLLQLIIIADGEAEFGGGVPTCWNSNQEAKMRVDNGQL